MNEVSAIKTCKEREAMKRALHGRNKLIFTLGVSLGLRISDLLALQIGDLRGKSELTVIEQKTKKRRSIAFNKTVKEAAATLTGPDTDYVFKSQKGDNKPISRVQAYRILNAAADRANITGAIGGHSLRKTHGWILHENGVDITRIMHMLNHSTPRMTLKYIGIESQEITAAYEAIEV